jgi:hypothetical protein
VRRRRPAGAAAVVALAVVGATSSGCATSAHPGLSSPETNACYRAIPPARAAVHDAHVTITGVHRLDVDDLHRRLPSAAVDPAPTDTALCAVALKGSFDAGQVDLAPPGAAGHYAVVLVTYSRLQVLGSVVLDRLPRWFGGHTV